MTHPCSGRHVAEVNATLHTVNVVGIIFDRRGGFSQIESRYAEWRDSPFERLASPMPANPTLTTGCKGVEYEESSCAVFLSTR